MVPIISADDRKSEIHNGSAGIPFVGREGGI